MPDDTDGVMFRMADVARIRNTVNDYEHRVIDYPQSGGASTRTPFVWYWAKVSAGSSITAGTLTVPTTFLFDIWLPDYTSTSDPKPFVVSTDSAQLGLTGVNRSNGDLSAGSMLKVEFAYGEWTPYWVDCN